MAPRVTSHTHQEGGPVCIHRTKAACDNAFADWQAMQSVLLAYLLARKDEKWWKKDRSNDATIDVQLVQYIAGLRPAIVTKEGNPSKSPWVKRLMAAIERVKAGDLPAYNLYRLPNGSDTDGGSDALH